jgi:hypothetical protein
MKTAKPTSWCSIWAQPPWFRLRLIGSSRGNLIGRLFRRLKGFRRIFFRFEKLDVIFLGFLYLALIVEAL